MIWSLSRNGTFSWTNSGLTSSASMPQALAEDIRRRSSSIRSSVRATSNPPDCVNTPISWYCLDRVQRQIGDLAGVVGQEDEVGRMAGGAARVGQRTLVDLHDVAPAEPGQVVDEAVADDAGADHHGARVTRDLCHGRLLLTRLIRGCCVPRTDVRDREQSQGDPWVCPLSRGAPELSQAQPGRARRSAPGRRRPGSAPDRAASPRSRSGPSRCRGRRPTPSPGRARRARRPCPAPRCGSRGARAAPRPVRPSASSSCSSPNRSSWIQSASPETPTPSRRTPPEVSSSAEQAAREPGDRRRGVGGGGAAWSSGTAW